MFKMTCAPISSIEMTEKLFNQKAGALVIFEGRVRDHNEGKGVSSLEYQVYEKLASKEGQRIIEEAKEKFNIHDAAAGHRFGHLKIGETAVWIGTTATHRDDAYKASRFIIDEIKHRLPVWKKEHYVNQEAKWVFCRDHHNHVHFSEDEFYQKQKMLIDQDKLKKSKVLVIGAGGLGCPALISLVSAGVGSISVMDFDKVSISNIHRQCLYAPNDVGEKKVVIAKKRLNELNPFIEINSFFQRFGDDCAELIKDHDLVLDCSDNLETKYFVHDACFKHGRPLISASVFKFDGQLRTFDPQNGKGCLRCASPTTPDDSLLGNCNDFGVLSPVVGVIGNLQASEALSYLSHRENSSSDHTLFFNVKDLTQKKIKNFKREGCDYCSGDFALSSSSVEISVQDLEQMNASLLDIRELTDEEVFGKVGGDAPLALYCHRGIRSKKLAKLISDSGRLGIYSLKGGACSL